METKRQLVIILRLTATKNLNNSKKEETKEHTKEPIFHFANRQNAICQNVIIANENRKEKNEVKRAIQNARPFVLEEISKISTNSIFFLFFISHRRR